MSEQRCELCGKLGWFSETMGEGNLHRVVHPDRDATFCHYNSIPCTRTYESLVGEEVYPIDESLSTPPHWFDKPTAVDEPELQLLVIDMGDCCVVRVEQGEIDLPPYLSSHTAHDDGVPVVVDVPFTELRSAIDGEKPYPRIEKITLTHYHYFWMGEYEKGGRSINGAEYDALSKLAGKPLPIYEGGKWEELIALQSKDEYGHWIDKRDFTAWRYRRD